MNTQIAEYTETSAALAALRERFGSLVVDVTTPKGLKEAKAMTFELRTLRTTLEKKRKDLKAPIIERGKLLDDEAKRITAEIVALEEPIDIQIKAEEARIEAERLAKLEAERLRVEAINRRIDEIRNLPATLVGKPSVIIQGKLERLRADVLSEDEFAEHYLTARDAHDACVARVEQLLAAQVEAEAEQRRIAEDRAELERIRAENERLQREADARAAAERAEADRAAAVERERIAAEQRQRDEAERAELERMRAENERLQREADERAAAERAEADRVAAVERERIAAEQRQRDEAERAERQRQEDEARAAREEQERAEREEQDRVRAEQESALQAERDRQAAEQKKLDEQAAKLRREKAEAARKAEADRLANLGLREAAQAVADGWCGVASPHFNQLITDLAAALANDAAQAKPARAKKAANA